MSLPLHEKIRSEIEADILTGVRTPGSRLPTEHDLMQHYGCSRMTVSKALSALAGGGLIERRKRAGSFVARPKAHSMMLDIPDLEQEIVQRGQRYRFELSERTIVPPGTPQAREAGLAEDGELLMIAGVHFADDVPLACESRLVSLAAVPEMAAQPFDDDSPGAWLLKHVPWTEAETRIASVAASTGVAAQLKLSVGAPCLFVERRTWRGSEGITQVRQHFIGSAYSLVARFGPAKRAPGS